MLEDHLTATFLKERGSKHDGGFLGRSKVQVLLVDDFKPYRDFVASLLCENPDLRIVGDAPDGLDAVEKAQQLQPDVVLMDIGLPELNGIEAARQIRKLVPSARIVFLTQEKDADYVQEALDMGALGYVLKSAARSDLLPAIETVLKGEQFVSRDLGLNGRTDAPHGHKILYCPDAAAFLNGLTRFIAAALNAGDAALVLASPSLNETIRQRLREQGVDIDAVTQRGTYVSWDSAETPDESQFSETIRALQEAASKAGKKEPRVALCSERTHRLWEEGKVDEVNQIEQFYNELAKNYDIDILCAYPSLKG